MNDYIEGHNGPWEIVLGLEVHAQVISKAKLFSGAATAFGAEVKRRVLIGTYVLSAGYYDAYYLKAQRLRSLILKDFTDAFETVDAILTPATPTAAFAIGERMDDPIAMYLNDVFTVPVNLAGLPGISVPAGMANPALLNQRLKEKLTA